MVSVDGFSESPPEKWEFSIFLMIVFWVIATKPCSKLRINSRFGKPVQVHVYDGTSTKTIHVNTQIMPIMMALSAGAYNVDLHVRRDVVVTGHDRDVLPPVWHVMPVSHARSSPMPDHPPSASTVLQHQGVIKYFTTPCSARCDLPP